MFGDRSDINLQTVHRINIEEDLIKFTHIYGTLIIFEQCMKQGKKISRQINIHTSR